jgi:hypothetical protein
MYLGTYFSYVTKPTNVRIRLLGRLYVIKYVPQLNSYATQVRKKLLMILWWQFLSCKKNGAMVKNFIFQHGSEGLKFSQLQPSPIR